MNVINSAFVPSHTKLLFKVKIKLRKDITFVETFFFFKFSEDSLTAFMPSLLGYFFMPSLLRDFVTLRLM